MPYYLHASNSEPETGTPYATKAEAIAARTGLDTISLRATDDEKQSWRSRESSRFDSGAYLYTPWHDRDWYTDAQHNDHFCHLSMSHPGMVAYTPSDAHGIEDRQLRVRPAKYLQDHFSNVLSKTTIDTYAAAVRASTADLQLATSTDEIVRVYLGGPRSCMGGADKGWSREYHPCSVYGESDLAVAFLGDIDHVSARCVVWPAKKLYTRNYGDVSLATLLQNHGYTEGYLTGAKIRVISARHSGYVMPYIDGIDTADLQHDEHGHAHFVLGEGDYPTTETCGTTDSDDHGECAHCGERCDTDETYCESCRDEGHYCEPCGETYFNVSFTEVDNYYTSGGSAYLCDSCANDYALTCPVCDDTRYDRRPESPLCYDCESTHHPCSECEEYTDARTDTCPDCTPDEDSDDQTPAVSTSEPTQLTADPEVPAHA